jgi:hypothetical protein
MGLARAIARLFNLAYRDSVGGFQEGQVAAFAGAYQVALPSWGAAHLQPVAGINRTAGYMAGPGSVVGEEVSVQKLGYARFLASPNVAVAVGGQVIADSAPNLGNVKQRIPFSSSAYVLGTFEESHQVGNAPELVEGECRPTWTELVRPLTGVALGAIGNNVTRYVGAPGVPLSQTPLPLYRARFDDEAVRNLGVTLQTAPAQGETVMVTISKSSDGGTTWVDTTLTCTINGPLLTGTDLTHWPLLASGDLLALKVVSYSTAAAGLVATCDVT